LGLPEQASETSWNGRIPIMSVFTDWSGTTGAPACLWRPVGHWLSETRHWDVRFQTTQNFRSLRSAHAKTIVVKVTVNDHPPAGHSAKRSSKSSVIVSLALAHWFHRQFDAGEMLPSIQRWNCLALGVSAGSTFDSLATMLARIHREQVMNIAIPWEERQRKQIKGNVNRTIYWLIAFPLSYVIPNQNTVISMSV